MEKASKVSQSPDPGRSFGRLVYQITVAENLLRCCHVIRRAQHLDLIYSQSGTLYDIIPNAPRPSNDTSRATPGPHADGVIGSVSTTSVSQVAGQLGQLALTDKPATQTPTTTSNEPAPSTDVNMVQTSKSSRRKNRNQQRKESSGEQEKATPK